MGIVISHLEELYSHLVRVVEVETGEDGLCEAVPLQPRDEAGEALVQQPHHVPRAEAGAGQQHVARPHGLLEGQGGVGGPVTHLGEREGIEIGFSLGGWT